MKNLKSSQGDELLVGGAHLSLLVLLGFDLSSGGKLGGLLLQNLDLVFELEDLVLVLLVVVPLSSLRLQVAGILLRLLLLQGGGVVRVVGVCMDDQSIT